MLTGRNPGNRVSWGTGSEHPTKAQSLGHPGGLPGSLCVSEMSFPGSLWGSGQEVRTPPGSQRGSRRPLLHVHTGGLWGPGWASEKGGSPPRTQEKAVGVSAAIRRRPVRQSLSGSERGLLAQRHSGVWGGGPGDAPGAQEGDLGSQSGSEGGTVPPPPSGSGNRDEIPPGCKGPRGPGRDPASLRGHSAPPPPGSQGRQGRDRSRLSSRPAAPRRPPAPGSRAGPPLALLPRRRAGPSSAPPRSRRSRRPRRPLRPRPQPPTPSPSRAISGSTRK